MFPSGITAEDLITRPKIGIASTDYGKSKYDKLQSFVAQKLKISDENVDIFAIRNHPTLKETVDLWISAHGSPYYHATKINSLLINNRNEVQAFNFRI